MVGLLLDDIDLEARIRDVERGLDARDTAADDERALGNGALARGKRRVQMHLCDCCSAENDSLFGSRLPCPYVSKSTARGCLRSRP